MELKKARPGSLAQLAQLSSIPYGRLWKLYRGGGPSLTEEEQQRLDEAMASAKVDSTVEPSRLERADDADAAVGLIGGQGSGRLGSADGDAKT